MVTLDEISNFHHGVDQPNGSVVKLRTTVHPLMGHALGHGVTIARNDLWDAPPR